MILTWLKRSLALAKKTLWANMISFAARGMSFGGICCYGDSMGIEHPTIVAVTASEVISWVLFFLVLLIEWLRDKRRGGDADSCAASLIFYDKPKAHDRTTLHIKKKAAPVCARAVNCVGFTGSEWVSANPGSTIRIGGRQV